jgi:hypothetical protein
MRHVRSGTWSKPASAYSASTLTRTLIARTQQRMAGLRPIQPGSLATMMRCCQSLRCFLENEIERHVHELQMHLQIIRGVHPRIDHRCRRPIEVSVH